MHQGRALGRKASKGLHLRLASARLSTCFLGLAEAACTSWLSFRRFSSLLKASGSLGADRFPTSAIAGHHAKFMGCKIPLACPPSVSALPGKLQDCLPSSPQVPIRLSSCDRRMLHAASESTFKATHGLGVIKRLESLQGAILSLKGLRTIQIHECAGGHDRGI